MRGWRDYIQYCKIQDLSLRLHSYVAVCVQLQATAVCISGRNRTDRAFSSCNRISRRLNPDTRSTIVFEDNSISHIPMMSRCCACMRGEMRPRHTKGRLCSLHDMVYYMIHND